MGSNLDRDYPTGPAVMNLTIAKTYAGLIGAVATALLGVYTADTTVGKALTAVAAVCTAIAVYAVPNAAPGQPSGPQDPEADQ